MDDIAFDKKASDVVELKSGPISYVEYYQKNYEITIRDANQPLLIHRAKTKVQGVPVRGLKSIAGKTI